MSQPLPRILALATAVPDFVLDQDEVAAGAAEVFAGAFADWQRLTPVYANAAIARRHSCVALDWYRRPHGFAERNRLYLAHAVDLLDRAASLAIERAGLSPGEVDGLVVVSSTGVATPSLDALLMERLPLRRDVQRLPIFGLGCAGGVLGLARAAQLACAEPGKRYLLLVVELCGLTFRSNDRSKSNVIATALFGDGAAAAVVSTRGDGATVVGWGEHTWPRSLDVMGWDVRDDGLAVVFSRDIPAWVRRHLREAAVRFLAGRGLTLADIDSFVCHPGGAKVLDALEEVFGLRPGGLGHSRDVLREYGNMSAATVLFVLERALAAGGARRHLLSTLGPGFTAGFALLATE
jgi:alkylresorcinol/alkylpyrone synthase